eukprot:GEMP01065305.1.p1 GENE.GEMP01065305.1~~GEMP01065305.1.p1  ORF type:complete len:156 (+),score=37.65 GEMP01065305.1:40-507(+)
MFALRRSTPTLRFVRNKVMTASAEWNGTLKEGKGVLSVGTKVIDKTSYDFGSRFEEGKKTNPEELIGAAHAGCYSMFLSALLSEGNLNPTFVKTTAKVTLGDGPAITLIELTNETKVDGIDAAGFAVKAQAAKDGCPISKALAGVAEIKLVAKLV